MDKMTIKAVGFDFDGTLIMSEKTKGQIMAEAFSENINLKKKDYQKIINQYPLLVGKGNSRIKKIDILAQDIVKKKVSLELKNNIANDFGKKYVKSMNHCPLFACHKMIQELQGKVEHLFLLSLEDQKEVRKIARHCQINGYFEIVLGGPIVKEQHFKNLLKKWKIKPSEMLYIGDSHGDVVAAKKVGIKTMLIEAMTLKSYKGHKELHKKLGAEFEVSSLCDVKSMFKQMRYKFVKKLEK
jgi:phosphoglycolate phosphatase-like HAD superfamily hydrolase